MTIQTLIIFAIFSVPVAIIDIREHKIPDILVFLGCAVLAAYQAFFLRHLFLQAIIGAILSPLLFFFIRNITNFGMGLGDVKYSIFCGLCAGSTLSFLSYVTACFLCLATFFTLKIFKKNVGRSTEIPFAPFMAGGIILICIWHLYKNLL